MKKFFFPLLLVLAMVLTACNNEVIIKEEQEKKQAQKTKTTAKDLKAFENASFLRDPKKVYTYQYSEGVVSTETIEQDNGKEQIWKMDLGSDSPQRNVYQEDQARLFVGIPDSEGYKAIAYPIKMGTTWEDCTDPENCTNYRIDNLLDSYKTPAGEFEHVVVIKSDLGSLTYYAKNIGLLEHIDGDGQILSQLKSLQDAESASATETTEATETTGTTESSDETGVIEEAAKPAAEIDTAKEVYNWDAVKDTTGKTYNVKVMADQDKAYPSDMSWAGAQEGDLIREGTYSLTINDAPQDVKIGKWLFNMNNPISGEVIGDTPNLIVVNQIESSNSYSSKLFYIHNGKMVEVKGPDGNGGFGHSGNHIYPISKDTFVISWYNNADIETYYEVFTYQIVDFTTGQTKLVKEEKVSVDESEAFFAPLKKYR